MLKPHVLYRICYEAENHSGKRAQVCGKTKPASDTFDIMHDHGVSRTMSWIYRLSDSAKFEIKEPDLDPNDRTCIKTLDRLGDVKSWYLSIELVKF